MTTTPADRARRRAGAARRREHQDHQHEHHEPRQLPRAEQQAAEHQRHDQRRERDVVGATCRRDADQHAVAARAAASRAGPDSRSRRTARLPATAASRRGRARARAAPERAGSWRIVARVLVARVRLTVGPGSGTCAGSCGHQNRLRPCEHLGAHRGAADVAGLPCAPVDVDLAAVVVARAAAGPSPRACARAGRCRSGRCARPRPSARPGRPTSRSQLAAPQRVAGPQRVDPVPEQHLGAVDVADTGEHRLVHQQRADRRPAALDPLPRRGSGSASARSGSGPERGDDRVALLAGRAGRRRWRRAGRRTPGRRRRRDQPQPDLADRRRHAPAPSCTSNLPYRPEVDVDEPVARRTRRTGACPPTRRRRSRGRRRAPRPRRTGPAGCSTAHRAGRRRSRSASPASRWRVCPSGIGRRPPAAPTRAAAAGRRSSRSRRASPIRRTCRSSPVNGGGEEHLDEAGHVLERVHPAADGDDVGVVVLAGQHARSPRYQASAQRMPVDLVGRDLLAVAGAADHDAEAARPSRGRRRRASAARRQKTG